MFRRWEHHEHRAPDGRKLGTGAFVVADSRWGGEVCGLARGAGRRIDRREEITDAMEPVERVELSDS